MVLSLLSADYVRTADGQVALTPWSWVGVQAPRALAGGGDTVFHLFRICSNSEQSWRIRMDLGQFFNPQDYMDYRVLVGGWRCFSSQKRKEETTGSPA